MDEATVCGRDNEIKQLQQFINSKVESKSSGILYLTGPPGTGKTMSIQYVLDHTKNVPKIHINCLRAQTSRAILMNLCHSVGLEKFSKCNEVEMTTRISKKFTGRTSSSYIIVLDEMDQLPKSRNINLIRTIFSWPSQSLSKLILIGIANTVNLTSRYQTISAIIGRESHDIKKIIFKPYTSQEIKSILNWYLENDENFEDANIDSKALTMIAAKFAREKGDIRGAINALKSTIDDLKPNGRMAIKKSDDSYIPTPPATPPLTPIKPCKEKTNLSSLANSIKKRQRKSQYIDDVFPFPHQVILVCIYKLCSGTQGTDVDYNFCKELACSALSSYSINFSLDEYRAVLDNLEIQGLITFKKTKTRDKVVLKASDCELNNLALRKDMILDLIKTLT